MLFLLAQARSRLVSSRSALLSSGRRGILTEIQEPPPVSDVLERPCTLFLAQDDGIYTQASRLSWTNHFADSFVNSHGISFADWSLANSTTNMESALQEMSNDLALVQSPIWVARGPWASWMAQFYLESLPLSGLVLIDPLPLEDQKAVQILERCFKEESTKDCQSSKLFQEYCSHWDHWALRLEPGAVPMMVVSTKPEWGVYAEATVQRHATVERKIPLFHCSGDDTEKEKLVCEISTWIDTDVL